MPSVYIAGPEVFEREAFEIGELKKKICAQAGFEGRYPLDSLGKVLKDPGLSTEKRAFLIYKEAEKMLRGCDLVIANLTPFRGPSADSGTVWEVGCAFGLGKPVFGYTLDPRPYEQKVPGVRHTDSGLRDSHGFLVEDFGKKDNIMIDCSIESRGGVFLAKRGSPLHVFQEIVEIAKKRYQELLAEKTKSITTSGLFR